MLGELIDLVRAIGMGEESDAKDILGRVYEYFLGGFAGSEGKRGGEFYTPRSVVRVLVEMLEPYKGRVYDPCCGSGGMFVQSEKFVEPRRPHRRHRHLRAGEQLHDVAAVQDEPRGARHRRRHPLEQRGQLPQGRTQGPALRLHPRQSAVQRSRTGAASGCARMRAGPTARRRSATPTTRGFSTSSTISPRTARRAWCWPTARCPRRSPARTTSAGRWSRPTWWTA